MQTQTLLRMSGSLRLPTQLWTGAQLAVAMSVVALSACGLSRYTLCADDACSIDGKCYANGQHAPHDWCLRCVVGQSTYTWTRAVGGDCESAAKPADLAANGELDDDETTGAATDGPERVRRRHGVDDQDAIDVDCDGDDGDDTASDSDPEGVGSPTDVCPDEPSGP